MIAWQRRGGERLAAAEERAGRPGSDTDETARRGPCGRSPARRSRAGGHAAQKPALAAVRVDDVGLEVARSRVRWRGSWRHRAADGSRGAATGTICSGTPRAACIGFEASLRPERRTGDQQHVVAVVAEQILAVEQRVLLRAAEDQPRDDVSDPHAEDGSTRQRRSAVSTRRGRGTDPAAAPFGRPRGGRRRRGLRPARSRRGSPCPTSTSVPTIVRTML